MLPAYFLIIAVMLRVMGGISYVRATLRGRARPNLVSWGLWSLTGLIAFVAQLTHNAGPEAIVTLAIALGPLAVCIAAVYKGAHRTKLTQLDIWSLGLAIMGIGLWLVSKDPLMALAMSIVADLFSNIPTLVKCYRKPESEHSYTYGISIVGMAVTLLTVTDWHLIHWLFPAYILAINATLFLTLTVFSRLRPANQLALKAAE